jgi:CBS domain-containing protein
MVPAGRVRRPRARKYTRPMTVREVMTAAVITAPAASPVRAVAELMRAHNVGAIVLVDAAGAPAGIVTDRDLAVRVVAAGADPAGPAAGHASDPVITAGADTEVQAAADLMAEHGIRRLPLLDAGRLAGIVTLDDLAVRTGEIELAHRMTTSVMRAALPDFYFFSRGE